MKIIKYKDLLQNKELSSRKIIHKIALKLYDEILNFYPEFTMYKSKKHNCPIIFEENSVSIEDLVINEIDNLNNCDNIIDLLLEKKEKLGFRTIYYDFAEYEKFYLFFIDNYCVFKRDNAEYVIENYNTDNPIINFSTIDFFSNILKEDNLLEKKYSKEFYVDTDYNCPYCKTKSEILNKKVGNSWRSYIGWGISRNHHELFDVKECKNCGNQFEIDELKNSIEKDERKNRELQEFFLLKKGEITREEFYKNIEEIHTY